jgi:small-conductance mechanosensitive channel
MHTSRRLARFLHAAGACLALTLGLFAQPAGAAGDSVRPAAPARGVPAAPAPEERGAGTDETRAPEPEPPPAARDDERRAAARSTEAPLFVANRQITVFRVPFLGVSPEDRARRTRGTLRELGEKGGPGKVTMLRDGQRRVLLVDGELALILVPGDADPVRGETIEAAAKSAAAVLEQVIAETREMRDRNRLIRGGGYAAAATVVFALAFWGLWRLRRWGRRAIAEARRRNAERMATRGALSVVSDRLFGIGLLLARGLLGLTLVLLVYQWLILVFGQFPYTRPLGEQLASFLLDVVRRIGGAAVAAVPDLVVAVVIFALARGAIALVGPVLERIAGQPGTLLDADTVRPTKRIAYAAVWAFALVMAYPYLPGSESEAFKGVSVLLGLMATVGGASLFGQAASGMILMYTRTIRVGEYVRIADHEGTVTELGTFTTRIRTGLGEELTLPNALILGNVTKNYSRAVHGRGYIVDTVVTIGYDTPWRQVEAMLVEAARRTPGVLSTPPPRVFQTALSDFYPEYRLVAQAIPSEPRPRAEVLANLHANIQDVFNEYGVQIMSPHYLGDPDGAKVVHRKDWYAAPATPPTDRAREGGGS